MSHSEEVTLADPSDHVRIVRSDSVSEAIDPRITPAEVATEKQLDESYLRQASDYLHRHEDLKHPEKADEHPPDKHEDEDEDGTLYVTILTPYVPGAKLTSTRLCARLSSRKTIHEIP